LTKIKKPILIAFCTKIIVRLSVFVYNPVSMKPAVAYYRLSIEKKNKKSYGLLAQKTANQIFFNSGEYYLVKEFIEIESGGRNDRKVLKKVLSCCRKHKAVLLISKLDRLARRVTLIATLLDSEIDFRVAAYPDKNPKVDRDRLFFLKLAVDAETELITIRERTKDGLAEAKECGVILGKNGKVLALQNKAASIEFAHKMQPVIETLKAEGFKSVRVIAKELNRKRIKTYRGKRTKWHANSVHRLLKQINQLSIIDQR
jgi:DNA invertase Pin-like site-specific DNA recombinase